MIQAILADYMEKRGPVGSMSDRRRHKRKDVMLPVFVSSPDQKGPAQAGVVKDISPSGLRISLPENSDVEVWREGKEVHLDLLLALPNGKVPATITCTPCRLNEGKDGIEIGAKVTDAASEEYRKLHSLLVQDEEP